MFVQNLIKLSAAVDKLSCWQREKNLATMLKTTLPSLLRAQVVGFGLKRYTNTKTNSSDYITDTPSSARNSYKFSTAFFDHTRNWDYGLRILIQTYKQTMGGKLVRKKRLKP